MNNIRVANTDHPVNLHHCIEAETFSNVPEGRESELLDVKGGAEVRIWSLFLFKGHSLQYGEVRKGGRGAHLKFVSFQELSASRNSVSKVVK